jgi:hypothetical protein
VSACLPAGRRRQPLPHAGHPRSVTLPGGGEA